MTTIDVRDIEKISLNDNDILVVRVPTHTDQETFDAIERILKKFKIDGIVVSDKNITFSKISKASYFEQYFKDHSK
jgi:flavodoxin